MDWITLAIIAAAGLGIGGAFMHMMRRAEHAALDAKVKAVSETVDALQTELAQSKAEAEARRNSQQQADIDRERAQGLLEEKTARNHCIGVFVGTEFHENPVDHAVRNRFNGPGILAIR